jgi:hypothetical protein
MGGDQLGCMVSSRVFYDLGLSRESNRGRADSFRRHD